MAPKVPPDVPPTLRCDTLIDRDAATARQTMGSVIHARDPPSRDRSAVEEPALEVSSAGAQGGIE